MNFKEIGEMIGIARNFWYFEKVRKRVRRYTRAQIRARNAGKPRSDRRRKSSRKPGAHKMRSSIRRKTAVVKE